MSAWGRTILIEDFSGFLQNIKENSAIEPSNSSRPLPSASFQVIVH
jgi:hypothetical protein